MGIFRIVRHYRRQEVDPKTLVSIRDIVNQSKMEWGHGTWGYQFLYPTQTIEVASADDIPSTVATYGPCSLHYLYFKSKTGRFVAFDARNRHFLQLEVCDRSKPAEQTVTKIEAALNLSPIVMMIRSAFVAHGFDGEGQANAHEVRRFLELSGLEVTDGKSFAPLSVSEKVSGRIEKGDILVAIVTPQDDPTWVTQEITRADTLGKHPFILKDDRVEFKGGILGDREYISFQHGCISQTFTPILEGLRELRGA